MELARVESAIVVEPRPGPAQDRIELIDSLRAIALFGVIVMNIGAMVMRFAGNDVMASARLPDFILMAFDLALVQGKARAAFAFLFGLGFALLMDRAASRGGDFRSFYARRMIVLLGFGLFNQAFLFWGDILCLYALLGLALLPLRSWPDRRLLRGGLALVVLPPLIVGGFEAIAGRPFPSLIDADAAVEARRGISALTAPDYAGAVAFNLPQTAMRYATDSGHMLIYALGVLGLFLLGAWAGRRGIADKVERHGPLLRRIAWICGPLGLAIGLVHASRMVGVEAQGVAYGLVTAAYVGLPLLAFSYLAVLALLFERRAKGLQAWLAPAGRMALTNYLLSGAIGGWVFYGYGLGALRGFSFAGLNLFAAALFAALALFSRLWLARFRFGPAEWLWRSLTYGAPQTMRRAPVFDAG